MGSGRSGSCPAGQPSPDALSKLLKSVLESSCAEPSQGLPPRPGPARTAELRDFLAGGRDPQALTRHQACGGTRLPRGPDTAQPLRQKATALQGANHPGPWPDRAGEGAPAGGCELWKPPLESRRGEAEGVTGVVRPPASACPPLASDAALTPPLPTLGPEAGGAPPSSFLPPLTLGIRGASLPACVCATCARRQGPGKQGTVSRSGWVALSPGGQDCRGGLREPLPFGVSRASGQLPEGDKAGAQTTRGGRRLGATSWRAARHTLPVAASRRAASGREAGRPTTPAPQS